MKQERISVPDSYLAKAKLEYRDWQMAWVREAFQNSIDAGARRIELDTRSDGEGTVTVSLTDNGSGMSEDTLRNALLTLGGSQKEENAVGGFGYAKNILFFAHKSYCIATRNLMVNGKGGSFSISRAAQTVEGTIILVAMADEPGLQDRILAHGRQLALNANVKSRIYIAGNLITQEEQSKVQQHEYTYNTTIGTLLFRELKENVLNLWVRIKGIPMFCYRRYSPEASGFTGYLDLTESSTEVMTANRDGLKGNAAMELQELLAKLVSERYSFKSNNPIELVINRLVHLSQTEPVTAAAAFSLDDDKQTLQNTIATTTVDKSSGGKGTITSMVKSPDAKKGSGLFQKLINAEMAERAKFISTLAKVSMDQYPDNFHLGVPDLSKYDATDLAYYLRRSWFINLAWEWDFMVRSILECEYVQKEHGPLMTDGTIIFCDGTHEGKELHIGFVFNPDLAGSKSGTYPITISLNPMALEDGWEYGDCLDIAIHEVTHLFTDSHGDNFMNVEGKIRKSLRRMYSEQDIVKGAVEWRKTNRRK